MNNQSGKAGMYILILSIGLVAGIVAGGELLRRMYNLPGIDFSVFTGKLSKSTETDSAAAVRTTPPPVVNSLEQTRKTAIVLATQRVRPCVVGIVVTQLQMVGARNNYNDFFDLFFSPEMAPQYRQVEKFGSGFIINQSGIIVTNYHVVEGAQKLFVNLAGGSAFEGTVIGVDEATDIAIVKISPDHKLACIPFGSSQDLMIGEWAIAIGNPFLNFINDAHPTVTVGVISALDRNFAPAENVYYQGMIQTDAAINPGNSGGPLLNALGQVVGINTFIYTGSSENRGSVGVGFAIPIDRARRVVLELITYGKRRPVWTGITVQNMNRALALSLGYNAQSGVVVAEIEKGSSGEFAGIKPNDVLVRLAGLPLQATRDIESVFLDHFVGDTITLEYLRRNKKESARLVLREYKGR